MAASDADGARGVFGKDDFTEELAALLVHSRRVVLATRRDFVSDRPAHDARMVAVAAHELL